MNFRVKFLASILSVSGILCPFQVNAKGDKKVEYKQKQSVQFYIEDGYRTINEGLRGNSRSINQKIAKDIKNISSFIKAHKSGVRTPSILYRGISRKGISEMWGKDFESYFPELEKETLIEKGFMSTTPNQKTAEKFIGNSGVILIIRIEDEDVENLEVAYLQKNNQEEEYLFNCGQQLEIENVDVNTNKRESKASFIIRCKAIPCKK